MGVFHTLMDKPATTLFQLAVRALMNVLALGFNQNLKLKKLQSIDIFEFKKLSKNIVDNMIQKNCYLESVTLDLSFISP